jgi:protein phosphatase
MRYTWATASSVGHLRDGNEDSVTPSTDGTCTGPLLVAVADGMGGHVGGEVASRLAIDAAAEPPAEAEVLPRVRVEAGNEAVIAGSVEDPSLSGMGTTLTLAVFGADGVMHIGHVGDSRLYLQRDGKLRQVTVDHTWVTEMQRRGQLTAEQAAEHPRRHLLTRVLGMRDVDVDEEELTLRDGDRVLLCSDGLTTMLADDAVAGILADCETPSDAVWALVEAADAAGGYDNTTVAVVDVAS